MSRNLRVMLSFDVAEAGAALAHGCDEEQAAFVNAFCGELVREARSLYGAQKQICYVQDRLDATARNVFGLPDAKENA